ncbi:hypothetical protein TRFO_35247 [Tritrichomonas foetus]|uniref:RING-type E3 ubiquitin transferase n=1 Tax=Tritrichomonas foetus TaxID=1144522 RepID=A0A1J4JGN0_9EUKA|nr:hypothetical protein TRFO_35247 [Tritrichomonas foetus]|eukprot:OHS98312.1 hypothetical protein TRFO_35247 [Tritrichomonas foetus]
MIFLLFSLCSSEQITYFMGNWTLTTVFDNTTKTPQSKFQLAFVPNTSINNHTKYQFYQARSIFKNTTDFHFDRYSYPMLGFSDLNNESYFFFQIPSKVIKPNISSLIEEHMLSIFEKYEIMTFTNLSFLYDQITTLFNDKNLILLNFSINPTNETLDPFLLNNLLNGTILHQNHILDLAAFQFNMIEFVTQGKIYGVLSAVFLTFSFYAWCSIFSIQSRSKLNQLSIKTYLMHTSFEFSYSVYLLNLCIQLSSFRNLFLLLFMAYLMIYFTFQMTLISNIWRASFDLGEVHPQELRTLFLSLFLQVTICLFLSLFAVICLFEYPFIPILFLYSPFIPQIIKSAYQNAKKHHDTQFTILMTMNRIFVLWYFFLYPKNIESSFSIGYAMFGTILIISQAVFVYLQNKFGGAFFLPKRFRKCGFDYSAGVAPPNTECTICMVVIEEGEETMVTPCHHAFHKDCLSRWMQEQMICPICRTTLPNTNEDEDENENENANQNRIPDPENRIYN